MATVTIDDLNAVKDAMPIGDVADLINLASIVNSSDADATDDERRAATDKLEEAEGIYTSLLNDSVALRPDIYQFLGALLDLRTKAIKKIEEQATQAEYVTPSASRNIGVLPPTIREKVYQERMELPKYFEEFMRNDPLFFNHNGIVTVRINRADRVKALGDVVNELQNTGYTTLDEQAVVNYYLNYCFDAKGKVKHLKYYMPEITCLYQGGYGVGELILDVSTNAERFTADNNGTVVPSDSADPGTYQNPIEDSRDFINLNMMVEHLKQNREYINLGNTEKLAYLRMRASFPNFLTYDMLYLRTKKCKATNKVRRFYQVPNELGTELYVILFKDENGKEDHFIPYHQDAYDIPDGIQLVARADGVVMMYNQRTTAFITKDTESGGPCVIMDGGRTYDDCFTANRTRRTTVINNALMQCIAAQNYTADDIITNKFVQMRLRMIAYIINANYTEQMIQTQKPVGFSGGGKSKMKKMTRRKHPAKSKSKSKSMSSMLKSAKRYFHKRSKKSKN
jgi:hypothetical protein